MSKGWSKLLVTHHERAQLKGALRWLWAHRGALLEAGVILGLFYLYLYLVRMAP